MEKIILNIIYLGLLPPLSIPFGRGFYLPITNQLSFTFDNSMTTLTFLKFSFPTDLL